MARLNREVADEQARIPTGEQLLQQADAINTQTLKPAVIKMMKHLQGLKPDEVKPDNICLCKGSSTHIMDVALATLVPKVRSGPKKKMLLFSTSWDGLKTLAAEAGMEASIIDGSVNAKALDDHIQKHILQGKYADNANAAKAEVRKQIGTLVMNIPENPIGKIPSDGEMQALAKVIEKYDIPVVIVDEIFAAPGHRSLLSYPGMAERCYTISSTSKNINTPNKIAYGYSANDSMAAKVKEGVRLDTQLHPVESAAYSAMLEETPRSYYEGNQEQYARKRRLVSQTMASVNKQLKLSEGLGWLEEPNYGCLGIVSLPKELTDGCGIKDSCQLAEYIYKLSGVRTMPIGDVNPNPERPLGVRINFSDSDHVLIEAIERIGVAVEHMKQKKPFRDIEGAKYRGSTSRTGANDILGAIAQLLSRMPDGHSGQGGQYGY